MSTVYNKVQRLLGARALGAADALEPYSRDESGLGPFPPEAVALVESAAEVSEILRLAALDRIPITPRGLGSGKTGGALAVEGGIVLSTERMSRIVEVDERDLVAVVEPGVTTEALQGRADDVGLFYPPDPASQAYCSLAGNVAENAGGPRALKYGVTREYVRALTLGLIGGETLEVGRRTVKGVTGFDLVALQVGSEGTLAVITQVVVKLLPRPPATATFLAQFVDEAEACAAVTALLRAGYYPRAIELLDHHVVDHLQAAGVWPLCGTTGAAVLVAFDGEPLALEQQTSAAAGCCERAGAREVIVATDPARERSLRQMRRGISPTLRAQHRYKYSEDIAVPRGAIGAMLQRLDALASHYGVCVAAYGHAGDGNLHVNILFDDEERKAVLPAVIRGVFEAAIALRGTLSGEHGIGLTKRGYMRLEQSESLLALQRKLKQVFDPQGLMNPGKLIP